MDNINEYQVNNFKVFHLTVETGIKYTIKVCRSKSEKDMLRLYYCKNKVKNAWVNFASCTMQDSIERVINLYFGFKGTLTVNK